MFIYNVLEFLIDEDIKKFGIIKGLVLKFVRSRKECKERVKKYFSWVSICMLYVLISICVLYGIME